MFRCTWCCDVGAGVTCSGVVLTYSLTYLDEVLGDVPSETLRLKPRLRESLAQVNSNTEQGPEETSRDRCDASWLFKMHVAPGRCRSLEPCGIGLKLLGRTSRVRCRERGGTVEILGKRPDAQVATSVNGNRNTEKLEDLGNMMANLDPENSIVVIVIFQHA
ncbi:hypothetical protein DY000_02016992 [Brassica cretica]|uniref:Uncharacterized protein n=1 Tax=Brassica cretica TaxID=69181 RepID=A0ABQ7DBR3_BRACR|nr:hypothetical protein DY000_02016992 [Brassica cretica]